MPCTKAPLRLQSWAWCRHIPNGAASCGQLELHRDRDGWSWAASSLAPSPLHHLFPGQAPAWPRWGGDGPTGCLLSQQSAGGMPQRCPTEQRVVLQGLCGHVPCPVVRVPGRIPEDRGARAVPCLAWGCLSRPSPELCPTQLPLSALISCCLLAALNMSRAQGDRKEPLFPRDGVVVKLRALGPPSHSLSLPSGHPNTPSRHDPGDGKACGVPPLSKKSPPWLLCPVVGHREPSASPKLCAECGLCRV